MGGKVLVAYGTKHGATGELAERIGAALREAGLEADVIPAGEVEDISGYGAVVLGSGVYYGRWLKSAVKFLKRWREELAKVPLWVFSSGPTGEGEPEELTSGWRSPKPLRSLLESLQPLDIAL
ncbi:MAG: flavodoxin domain-containing protein, partial [Actinomycetota bacterium]|nr:flavodoxin domain-containing protein [Actinomycetota bacterium]